MDVPVLERTFIDDIKRLIEDARLNTYAAINAVMLETYWNIGKRIVEQEQQGKSRAEYGTQLLKVLSGELSAAFGKGFSARNLRNYRQFYLSFPHVEIWHTRVPNLTWSHIRTLLRVTDDAARIWYLNEAAQEMWSVRTLDRNISSQYYHRLLQSPAKEKVVSEMKSLTAAYERDKLEFIKNPMVAEFLGLASNMDFTESKLESAILTHLQKFIMEMGKGYAFVARQQHISTDAGDYYIDLVFYNFILKCFLLIDLKTTQISHQDVGQMDMYVRMYDEMKRTDGDNPTIGLILCSETSRDIARYSVLHENPQLFTAKYLTYLPSEEELRKDLTTMKLNNINAIRTWSVTSYIIINSKSAHRTMIRIQNLTSPESRTHQRKVFQRDMLAVGNQYSPHPLAIIIHNPAQSFCFVFFPHFPIFIPKYFSPAVQRSFSADGSVLFIDNVDNCRGPCHLDSCNPRTEFGIMMNGWAGQ